MQTGEPPPIDLQVVVFGRPQPRLERHVTTSLRDAFLTCGTPLKAYVSHYAKPEGTFNSDRQQHASGPYLHFLDVFNPNEPHSIKLGIVDDDLYSDSHVSLTYIFGEARVGGNCCVVSTARLDPRFYHIPFNEGVFHDRAVKEAVHEIGHVLGLPHCDDVRCIMHFSNCIEDTDIKHVQPCGPCTEQMGVYVKRRWKARVTREQGSGPG